MAREAPWKPNRTVVSLTENRILDVRTPKRRRHQPPRKVEATTALQCPERNPRSLRHPPSAETRSATRVSAEIRLRTEIRPPTQIPPPQLSSESPGSELNSLLPGLSVGLILPWAPPVTPGLLGR